MMTEKNIAKEMWLEKEFRSAENDVRLWPEWMKRGLKKLPPMKKLIFGKGLFPPTLCRNKKITIRKFRTTLLKTNFLSVSFKTA